MREILRLAFELTRAVDALMARTRAFHYEVMLSGHRCPRCDGTLRMTDESCCSCVDCGHEFDPTITYQRCSACDGTPRLRVCRYVCRRCGRDLQSRFVFDGHVFDREYFRQRMAEARERKRVEHESAPPIMIPRRSEELQPAPACLAEVPGLTDALDGLAGAPDLAAWVPLMREGFDLNRYQAHLQAHIGRFEVCFDDLPPLEDNARMDRIWRFVTLVFMAHAGNIRLWQEGRTIWVMEYGTDREGQGISGEVEAIDGIA